MVDCRRHAGALSDIGAPCAAEADFGRQRVVLSDNGLDVVFVFMREGTGCLFMCKIVEKARRV
jgi:hypothetical protein